MPLYYLVVAMRHCFKTEGFSVLRIEKHDSQSPKAARILSRSQDPASLLKSIVVDLYLIGHPRRLGKNAPVIPSYMTSRVLNRRFLNGQTTRSPGRVGDAWTHPKWLDSD